MKQATTPQDSHLRYAQLLKAAGDDLRLSVLQVLAKDSYGVMELSQMFATKQSGMSHHLKVLANAGLVSTRREGNSVFYRRSVITPDDPFSNTKKALFEQVDSLPVTADLKTALDTVWRERSAASQRFFVENAEKFRAQQDLIASFEVYSSQVAELLAVTPVPASGQALEVGPGRGEFLEHLAERFNTVTALDNSAQMLEQAKQFALQQQLGNVQLQLGDTALLADYPAYFDLAVINMVLHHTASPSRMLQEVAAALKPNGGLLITELCLHDQAWTRDACGDLWLGFAPDDLIDWAEDSNLSQGQSVFFALRNGFQIQIHQFFKPYY